MEYSGGNVLSEICDDVIIYISFFLPPREVIGMRLLDKQMNDLFSSCDYLWKTLLIGNSSGGDSSWDEYKNNNSSPPSPFKSWMSCFLACFNCLIRRNVCFRIFRNTTTKFLTRGHDIHYRDHGYRFNERKLDVHKLHIKVFNFGSETEKIKFEYSLGLYAIIEDPETKTMMRERLFTYYKLNCPSIESIVKPIEYGRTEEFTDLNDEIISLEPSQIVEVFTDCSFFQSSSVMERTIENTFDCCKEEEDVGKLVFFLSPTETGEERTNLISVGSDHHHPLQPSRGNLQSSQNMTVVQSRAIKKELEEFMKRKNQKSVII